jgi:phosphinothricin acetyltransferase
MMEDWFAAKERGAFPVIGVVDDVDQLMAFGTYGTFRALPAYKYTVEHSVYVQREHRGKGLGVQIMQSLIEHATQQGFHNLIGCVDARNAASIALHLKCGFKSCGVIRHAGFKFGEWIDLSLYQLLLDAPAHPVDG